MEELVGRAGRRRKVSISVGSDSVLEPSGPPESRRGSEALLAFGVIGILTVLLVPMPPGLLDILLVLSLTSSFVILLTAALITKPLEFSSFPSLLLMVTFFRVSLNIATTRLILGRAQDAGLSAAGGVVQAFASFVTSANLAVGIVIFVILIVVQFLVITKGATRISEVSARFVLDSLPGKQLSIDNDLASGLIGEAEARARRKELHEESAFFGAMDGASKFVRGEALAGLVITATNIIGGLSLGVFQHGMGLGEAAGLFTRLTVGDGLVTQVPSLLVSVALALLVSKDSSGRRLDSQLRSQLLRSGNVFMAAGVFSLILLPSGLPPLPLGLLGALALGLGYALNRRPEGAEDVGGGEGPSTQRTAEAKKGKGLEPTVESVRSLLALEPLEVELGYRLIDLVDESRGGDLLNRLGKVRERIALELGLVVPPIKVRDNTRLHPSAYCIKLRGTGIGQWRVRRGHCFVVTEGETLDSIDGAAGVDPVTGKAGLWVDNSKVTDVFNAGYRPRAVIEIIAEHIDKIARVNAPDILTREEASRLVADLKARAPALVDDLVPGILRLGDVHKVLQSLLREQVSIRDLEHILETLADHGGQTKDTVGLTELVRKAMARTICASIAGRDGILHGYLLDPALEEFLQASLGLDGRSVGRRSLEPEVEAGLIDVFEGAVQRFPDSRQAPLVVCSRAIRPHLRRLVEAKLPFLVVLAEDEISDDVRLEECGTLALENVA